MTVVVIMVLLLLLLLMMMMMMMTMILLVHITDTPTFLAITVPASSSYPPRPTIGITPSGPCRQALIAAGLLYQFSFLKALECTETRAEQAKSLVVRAPVTVVVVLVAVLMIIVMTTTVEGKSDPGAGGDDASAEDGEHDDDEDDDDSNPTSRCRAAWACTHCTTRT
jgi:hypothetical protein